MSRDVRMLLVDPAARALGETGVSALPALLTPRDLVVVNDAATLPASFAARSEAGAPVEIRLLEAPLEASTRAVLLGAGDHRTPTEHRPPPPELAVGDVLLAGDDQWVVAQVSPLSPRLVTLAWPGDLAQRFELVYRRGRPVQYSYVPEPLALWDVQTLFATRPWAVEMPSAARPLAAATLAALRERGVPIATLTHAAGLSSTGDARIDAVLPLPERYDIPQATVALIEATRQAGGRVLAIGTTVVRALEDSAKRHGRVVAGSGTATLVLGAEQSPQVVSGLLSGIHMPGESHYRLLQSFVDRDTLARSAELARTREYRQHEFGEACLVLPGVLATSSGTGTGTGTPRWREAGTGSRSPTASAA
jgi:S-adenosylmethionine:tRNA ribosyltransferase-isomerase